MRLIRFLDDVGQVRHGIDQGNGSAAVLPAGFVPPFQTVGAAPIAKRLCPVQPPVIICVGRNFLATADGNSATAGCADEALEVFLKPLTALQHPDEPIRAPRFAGLDPLIDIEGELAIVIGRDARNIDESEAKDHILGYTIANDVTARAFQTPAGPPIWMRGKGFDTFCPVGPCLVTSDEIHNLHDLRIMTIANGKVLRDGRTSQMIWPVPRLLATLSRHLTIPTGSMVLTGSPPRLSGGDLIPHNATVEIEIEGIGQLRNTVIQG